MSQRERLVQPRSAQGVQQGDPLGPLLYSLGMRSVLTRLQYSLVSESLVAAYLDDTYIFSKQPGSLEKVKKFFEEAKTDNSNHGSKLNTSKCKEASKEETEKDGLELLGLIGSAAALAAFLEKKIRDEVSYNRFSGCGSTPLKSPFSYSGSATSSISDTCFVLYAQRTWEHRGLILIRRYAMHYNASEGWIRRVQLIVSCFRYRPESQTRRLWSANVQRPGSARPSNMPILHLSMSSSLDPAPHLVKKCPLPEEPAQANEMYASMKEFLIATLSLQEIVLLVQNESEHGRAWLDTLPLSRATDIDDSCISFGLVQQTLRVTRSACIACGKEISIGHDDICSASPNLRTARHERLKHLIVKFVKRCKDSNAINEPRVAPRNGQLRTELEQDSRGAQEGREVESRACRHVRAPRQKSKTEDRQILKNRLNRGTMPSTCKGVFAHWKELVPPYHYFRSLISIELLTSRARYFRAA